MCRGKQHHGAQCLPPSVCQQELCLVTIVPLPLSPLPGATADASWVTGELWLLLQRPWRCLLDVEAIPGADPQPGEVWYRAAAPAWTPRCRELSCCLSLRKEPPGKPLGSQIFRHLVLFLVQFPVLVGTVWKRLRSHPVCLCPIQCPVLCLAFRVLALL